MIENKNNTKAVESFNHKVWIASSVVALMIAFLWLFKALFGILLLVLAGVLMAIYFHGCAGLLHRWLKIPYKFAVLASVLLNLVLLSAFFWFVGARLQAQVAELSQTLPGTINHAKDWLKQAPLGDKVLDYFDLSSDSAKTIAVAKQFFSSSFGILSDVYIIVLLGLFFTAGPAEYKTGIIKLLPLKAKAKGNELLEEISKVLKNWIKGQLFGFVFIGVLSGVGLLIIGMPLILTLALVAGLMNFIPNFGPIIALVPAVLLALMEGTTTALIVVCLYTGIQIVQSAVTQPLIQKKMVDIPPALVIFGQVAMGILAGFWGILLATPVIIIIIALTNKLYIERQSVQDAN
ncbi:AI-2E family transporter [Pedobacter endophyticus]|uniref:AI-2E family transporter n=1 Tax=Pedobacter endophyticus TaxID=2789740 RepID=A0A7U3Q6F4_9SPHI|nr:AI-2E family transporter [Pedobacter endophyticus]QPH38602.1 AI-2E family transporter [Pedobacter endophyticus]